MKAPRQPRICMVVYTDYRFDARVRREAETLAEAGFKVTCFTPRNDSKRAFSLRGVDIRELPVHKYQGKSIGQYMFSYCHFLLSSSVACSKLLSSEGFDAVHVHNLPDFLVLAGLLPRLFGKRVVLDIHDSVPETYAAKFSSRAIFLQPLLKLEERLSTLLAHRVICVNHPQRERLIQRGLSESKTFVSMNVPDHRLFSPRSHPRSTDCSGVQLVYHGTMANRLGVDLIIRAVAEIADRIPGLRLNLWGYGDDLPTYQALVKDLSLQDCVLFNSAGYEVHELPMRLAEMDIGVIGNRRDCATELMLPVKLLEYIAVGVPVVAPRLRTIRHYLDEDMATFYEPESVSGLAGAILKLSQRADRRHQQTERASAFLEKYSWKKQGEELVAMYRGLLGR